MAALYWAGDYLMNFLTLVTFGRDCLDRLSYRFQADFSMNYPIRRKTPCFSYGDIRRVHRIYASN